MFILCIVFCTCFICAYAGSVRRWLQGLYSRRLLDHTPNGSATKLIRTLHAVMTLLVKIESTIPPEEQYTDSRFLTLMTGSKALAAKKAMPNTTFQVWKELDDTIASICGTIPEYALSEN